MLSRYYASLNGYDLAEISESIRVLDIAEDRSSVDVTVEQRAITDGTRFLRSLTRKTDVAVYFVIREQDPERRNEVCQSVQQWARSGGLLQISDRPGQELRVRCTQLPFIASSHKWSETLQVVFTAFENPYWENVESTSVTISGTGSIFVPGTAEKAKASAIITNNSGKSISTVEVQTEKSVISFSGLSFANGQKLEIGQDENGYFFAKIGNASILGNRSTQSDDELFVPTGYSDVKVTASQAVTMTLSTKGAWI